MNIDRHCRSALSLLEILLVLVLLVILFSISVPWLAGVTLRSELTNSAAQVQTALSKARNVSMRSGNAVAFLYQPDSGLFGWAPMPIDQATIQQFEATQSTLTQLAARGTDIVRAEELGQGLTNRNIQRLPGDVIFVDCGCGNAANGGLAAMTGSGSSAASGVSGVSNSAGAAAMGSGQMPMGGMPAAGVQANVILPTIVFEADGTCGGDALLVLSNTDGEQIAVAVRGLTGSSRISETSAADRPFVAGGYQP